MNYQIGDVTFYDLLACVTTKQYALEFDAPPAKYARAAYHPISVDGSYTVGGGKMERTITCSGRFIESTEDIVRAVVSAFRDAIEDTPITITGPDGLDYKRCFIQSMRYTRRPRHCRQGAFADVEFTFTQYGETS